ncbi:MAG: hypothetical protein Q9183_007896 [Haloplaca sp. 2 TL-2023]
MVFAADARLVKPQAWHQSNLRQGVDDSESKLTVLPDTPAPTRELAIDRAVAKPDEGTGHKILLQSLGKSHGEGQDGNGNSSDG